MKQTYSRRSGFSSATIMLLVATFSMTGFALFSLSTSQNNFAGRSASKTQADLLAKTAADVFYDQIRNGLQTNGNYPFTLDPVTLTTTVGGTDINIGTYQATLADVVKTSNDTPYGSGQIRTTEYDFVISATGTMPNGVTSTIKYRFRGWRQQPLVQQSTAVMPTTQTGQIYFPIGAVVSNTGVTVATDNSFSTVDPTGQNNAHVLCNDGITWNPSGSKSLVSSTNVLNLQGQFLVPQGGAYDRTVSSSGIGNSNGCVNYANPGIAASSTFAGSPANSVLQMGGPVGFADATTVGSWVTRWNATATATGATNVNGSLDASTLGSYNGIPTTLKCPAFINGELDVRRARH